MSLTRVRPRPATPQAGALRRCPECGQLLANGPIVFYCCGCRRHVRAADVPAEITTGRRSEAA